MKLTRKQISKIDKKISIADNRTIVEVDVSDKSEGWQLNEISSNIYCVDLDYNIVWQVREIKTESPFSGRDPFCYLTKTDSGEIMAVRFSGFRYKINPETGEAVQVGFSK